MKSLIIALVAFLGYHKAELVYDLCKSQVYCEGQLLNVIQCAKLYNDSKSFVDLVQKNPETQTLANFNSLMLSTNNKPTKDQLRQFVSDNFIAEDELVPWTPDDYQENPDFLNKIADVDVKAFAKKLNAIWPTLARKVNDDVSKKPDQHSLIPFSNGFIIPGGRFKEIYYWDSYWIVKGLLICGMTNTARGMLENHISLVKRFGFVPNGSRVYYLNRSQPPLLSLMVGLYIDATSNTTFLQENIVFLEQELNWWLENRAVTVTKGSASYNLLQYAVKSGAPRPESYYEDIQTCDSLENKENCFRNIRSAAESGWDFSSRWIKESDGNIGSNLSCISTNEIVPVDLNSYYYAALGQLSRFYQLIGDQDKATKYQLKQAQWKQAISKVFYNKLDGIWYDWDLELKKQRKGFYPSNFAPLWAKAYDTCHRNTYGFRAARYFTLNHVELFAGGIPTSLLQSKQQWDLPNAWPPLQEILALGLQYTGNSNAVSIAASIKRKTLNAYMIGLNNSGEMFEKYDANIIGQYGGGGEYTVQSGFGWTNGVAFSFIQEDYIK